MFVDFCGLLKIFAKCRKVPQASFFRLSRLDRSVEAAQLFGGISMKLVKRAKKINLFLTIN